MDNENQPPHPKKPKLSSSLKKNRFKINCFRKASDSDLQQIMKAKIPKINTRWDMKNFTDLLSDYNLRNPESICPEEVNLPLCPAESLNKWLCVYTVKTRSQSGEPYPPASLYSLLSGILRHMRSKNPTYFFITNHYHLHLLTPTNRGILPFQLGEILLQRWSHQCVKKQA